MVRVRMTIAPFAMILTVLWVVLAGSMSWNALLELRWSQTAATGLLMMAGGLLLPIVLFYPEAWAARHLIQKAMAEPVDP